MVLYNLQENSRELSCQRQWERKLSNIRVGSWLALQANQWPLIGKHFSLTFHGFWGADKAPFKGPLPQRARCYWPTRRTPLGVACSAQYSVKNNYRNAMIVRLLKPHFFCCFKNWAEPRPSPLALAPSFPPLILSTLLQIDQLQRGRGHGLPADHRILDGETWPR